MLGTTGSDVGPVRVVLVLLYVTSTAVSLLFAITLGMIHVQAQFTVDKRMPTYPSLSLFDIEIDKTIGALESFANHVPDIAVVPFVLVKNTVLIIHGHELMYEISSGRIS